MLSQIVRLIQYYESDPIVLGLCGQKAKLMQKYGISEITDQLLENEVTIRVNVGLGAGDPQQRLAKFQSAVQVAMPLLQLDQKFQTGEKKINSEAVMEEVFGAAGYRDGGKRFIIEGPPNQNPMAGASGKSSAVRSSGSLNTGSPRRCSAMATAAATVHPA